MYIICSEGDAVVSRIYESPTAEKNVEIDVNRTVWLNHITKRTVDVLETHDIRILFDEMMNKGIPQTKINQNSDVKFYVSSRNLCDPDHINYF